MRLVAPVLPSKVIAVGRNYADHARELGNEVPAAPMIFLKPSTSVIGPGEPIMLPWQSEQVEQPAGSDRFCRRGRRRGLMIAGILPPGAGQQIGSDADRATPSPGVLSMSRSPPSSRSRARIARSP